MPAWLGLASFSNAGSDRRSWPEPETAAATAAMQEA
jgi:hypothetical protein